MIVGNFEPNDDTEHYDYIYKGLKKYRNDETFKKAIPDTEDMINMLEKDKYLLYEYAEMKSENFLQQVSLIIDMFDNDVVGDIRWFYENKDKYLKDIICYEPTDDYPGYYDYEFHEAVCFYSECKDLDYMDIYTEMYLYDRLFLCTHESFIRRGETVKNGLECLANYINEHYEEYKEEATKDRDIFKELDDTISLLKEYTKDEIFLKEVPNAHYIISELERGYLSGDEDIAYKSYWLMSDIRSSFRLYGEKREDMEYFYRKRFEKNKYYEEYLDVLDSYTTVFSGLIESKSFSEFFNQYNIEIKNYNDFYNVDRSDKVIKYNKSYIQDSLEFIVSEIEQLKKSEMVIISECEKFDYEKDREKILKTRIYENLNKYRDDEVFKKLIEDDKEIIEKDKIDLYKYLENKEEDYLCKLDRKIDLFKEKREDIEWFYENRDKYIEDFICYESIDGRHYNNGEALYQYHEGLCFYKSCKKLNYLDVYEEICLWNYFFIERSYEDEDIENTVKARLEYINNYLKKDMKNINMFLLRIDIYLKN